MKEKDEWVHYLEIEWDDKENNRFNVDTRDFHVGYRLEETRHKDIDIIKKYPDFFEKVFNQSPDVVPITPIIGEAILESDIGQDVAYYLGTHPAEAQRLAKLSPTAALREFGKIEASLSKPQSSAPKPITPINGKQAPSDDPLESDDMATYIAKRNRQLGRKR